MREAADMQAKLSHVIKFVGDMDRAVKYHNDTLGLPLKFQSPGWSEFATGDVSLALHPASPKNPAGTIQLGYAVQNLNGVYAEREKIGIKFTSPPKPEHGIHLATFTDSEGAECSISG
jgi:catechol 2,3-dioxygenase-like lactoylglutathione lyase family enzyme